MTIGRSLRSLGIWALALVIVSLSSSFVAFSQRLSSNIIPQHYALTLQPDLKAATFSGAETVDIEVKQPTSTITLNAIEIAIQSASISVAGVNQAATISFDDKKQQAIFTFPRPVAAGRTKLHVQFTGILNNELRGFYLSRSDRRNYAVTQFEATDARRAFPCFDEPALKATFDVSLVVDDEDTAISNGPILRDTPGPGPDKHTLKFLTTPRMSTYLLAFLVGDFQCTSGEQDGVAIRSCATPDKVAQTQYSLEFAKFALHYFNTYFGIPYPLKKLDLVAIPDFEAGAMENFGAITYRETALLIDQKTASIDAKKLVATDVAHEMAHQWFGDLVTMQWWDNLWLNEGFATWMETKTVAVRYPEWNIDQSVVSDMDTTLNIDAQPTTRPIRAKADTPDEINQMFDSIAYNKAGAVLLSVENYVGPEAFRKGIHNYLAAHLYSNATAEDFWNAETAASNKPIDRVMDSLVTQPGVPILTFSEPANGSVSVSQKRFFLDPKSEHETPEKWTVPVCFKTLKGQSCALLTPKTTQLDIPNDTVFFTNAGGKGYYRSIYPPDVYQSLVAHIESSLTPSERISFIGDEWARLRANKASTGEYLDLVAAVKDDPNAQVIETAIEGIQVVYVRVAATDEEKDALSAWIRRNFSPQYSKLGPPTQDESPNKRQLRAQLFSILGLYGKDPAVLAQARSLAQQYLSDPSSVEPTLRQTALSIAAQNGDTALFDQFLNIYETSDNPELKISALRWLATFHNPELVQRALHYAVSSKVRNQDAVDQLGLALLDEENRAPAWQFIQTHWNAVQAEFTTEMGARLIGSADSFCTVDERDSMQQFFATHKVDSSDVTLRHSIETINGCIELRTLQEPQLRSWLAQQPRS